MTKAKRKGHGELGKAPAARKGKGAPATQGETVHTSRAPMEPMRVRLTFTEECLGTLSAKPDIMRDHIASKRPGGIDEAEIAALPDVDDTVKQETTVFARTKDGGPMLWDYQIKGFFKGACSALRRGDPNEFGSPKIKAHKKIIDGCIFPEPRQIALNIPTDGEMGICERPLRASTAQGERIALARSETVPAGTTLEFDIVMLNPEHAGWVQEWLDYGRYHGIGQWRNSGKGRFLWEELNG